MTENISLSGVGRSVIILDQSLLPTEERELTLSEASELFEAVSQLRVRGAPAIGIFAGYGLYVLSLSIESENMQGFLQKLNEYAAYLNSSRPTAVNLSWALKRCLRAAESAENPETARALLKSEAEAIHREDIAMCWAISEYGLTLLRDGDGLLTHCNAGPLATSRYGTALGPILLGTERGMKFRVFADETRPLLQGARLTSYELYRAGVDVTLICDNMASSVMSRGWVSACLVGCDRVAANGDVANKIGTGGVAVLAKHYGIPFYVLGPCSTVDMSCPTGADIEIEQRSPDEIRSRFFARPMAPEGVKCYNPAFDVTDASLITAIITDRGICRPPYTQSLAAAMKGE